MSYHIFKSLFKCRNLITLQRDICLYRILCGSHYDTLQLPRNCTTKQVRDSFIRLSKQCHPDMNRDDPNTHAQFVKLNEAYTVLSRPDKRREYDLTLKPIAPVRYKHRSVQETAPFDVYTTAYRQRVVWRDESFWEFKDKTSNDYSRSGDYYGIKGIKRIPNGWIALMCVVFAAAGLWIQVLLMKHSVAFSRQSLDERSQEAGRVLADVQERAQKHGNKVQLELLKQKVEKAQASSGSSSGTPLGDSLDNKDHVKRHPKFDHHEPQEVSSSSIVLIPEQKMQEPTDFIKPFLGYLSDMPHRVERDNFTPVLCNTKNGIVKKSETEISEQKLPNSIVHNSKENVTEAVLFEQDFIIPTLCISLNNVIDENSISLCSSSNYIKDKNKQISVNPKMISARNNSANNTEVSVTELDISNSHSLRVPVNREIHNTTLLSEHLITVNNSHVFSDNKRQKIEVDDNNKQNEFLDENLPETLEPALHTNMIMLADSEIFCENILPNRTK